jgi:hypothetical protein
MPDQGVGPGGEAVGPAVEVVKEAARRRNIHLQWIHMPGGPEPAMSSGAVDLWPLFGVLPERAGRFFISRPWPTQRYWLTVNARGNIGEAGQFAGKTRIPARRPHSAPQQR